MEELRVATINNNNSASVSASNSYSSSNAAGSSSRVVSFVVGKVDAGMTVLLTQDHHVLELPALLLPDSVKAGSMLRVLLEHDPVAEKKHLGAFTSLQDSIFARFSVTPKAPLLELSHVSQGAIWCKLSPVPLPIANCTLLDLEFCATIISNNNSAFNSNSIPAPVLSGVPSPSSSPAPEGSVVAPPKSPSSSPAKINAGSNQNLSAIAAAPPTSSPSTITVSLGVVVPRDESTANVIPSPQSAVSNISVASIPFNNNYNKPIASPTGIYKLLVNNNNNSSSVTGSLTNLNSASSSSPSSSSNNNQLEPGSSVKITCRMKTSGGCFISNPITVLVKGNDDFSSLRLCIHESSFESDHGKALLAEIEKGLPGAHVTIGPVSFDHTHLIADSKPLNSSTTSSSNANNSNFISSANTLGSGSESRTFMTLAEREKALEYKIPMVKKNWVLSCIKEKVIVPTKGFELFRE